MCGIVGIFTVKTGFGNDDYFKNGLYASALRGADATGLLKVGTDNTTLIYKKPVCSSDFLQLSTVFKILATPATLLLGHCRAATLGNKHALEAAHPFQEGNIIGVHNGTLTQWERRYKDRDMISDSHYIIKRIDTIGIKETVADLQGAFTIVYWDIKEKTLNIIRNEERPIIISYNKSRGLVMFASEIAILDFAAKRAGITLDKSGKEQNAFWTADPGSLFTYSNSINPKIEKLAIKESYKPFKAGHSIYKEDYYTAPLSKILTNKEMEDYNLPIGKKVLVSFTSFSQYYSSGMLHTATMNTSGKFPRVKYYHGGGTGAPIEEFMYKAIIERAYLSGGTMELIVKDVQKTNKAIPKKMGSLRGPDGIYVSRKIWYRLTKEGCGLCGGAISTADEKDIKWMDSQPLCLTCSESINS